MISYQQVATQIQTYSQRLQVATTDAERRECFAAIRALCDIGLATGSVPVQTPTQSQSIGMPQSAPPVQQASPSVPLTGKRFEEDDANGDSLFDF